MARSLAKREAKRTRENIVAHNTPYRYLPFYLRYFLYFLNEIPLVFPGETFTEGDTERERETKYTHIHTHTRTHSSPYPSIKFRGKGGGDRFDGIKKDGDKEGK